ncbi:MAG TPA: phosphonoacetaldehyde hydrolase, partial [Devosia sp.]|nr:phosphonoacetaldehyde hydrolase [Devosia sp.]
AAAWEERHGRAPTEADIDAVYAAFVPKNVAVAAKYADLIPGAAAVAAALRERGIKIGSTTGYTREIMAEVLPIAARQGFSPDAIACTGDAADGRPTPLLYYRNLLELGVWPAFATVKVDDTEVGIAEGLNAGAWTVGVALTGNLLGLSLPGREALPPDELAFRRQQATNRMMAAGAHYVIDGIGDLLPVLEIIEGRLVRGERP